jgi:hypothetical protein
MRITKDRLSQIILEEASKMDEEKTPVLTEGFLNTIKGLFASKPAMGVSEEVWDTVINAAQQLEKNYIVAKQDAQRFAKKAEEQSKEIKELKAKLKEFNPPEPAVDPMDDTQYATTGGTGEFKRRGLEE